MLAFLRTLRNTTDPQKLRRMQNIPHPDLDRLLTSIGIDESKSLFVAFAARQRTDISEMLRAASNAYVTQLIHYVRNPESSALVVKSTYRVFRKAEAEWFEACCMVSIHLIKGHMIIFQLNPQLRQTNPYILHELMDTLDDLLTICGPFMDYPTVKGTSLELLAFVSKMASDPL